MLIWVKVAVGVLVMAVFSLPLVTVFKYRHLRDEPMAVLVAYLSGFDFLFGLVLSLLGLLEITLGFVPACTAFQFMVVATAGAVKVSTLCIAVDQYTAVTSPLRYYVVMERRLRALRPASWLMFAWLLGTGAAFHWADSTTVAQFSDPAVNATVLFPGCRWEAVLPSTYMFLFEGKVFAVSLVTSLLFLFTAVVGWRQSRSIQHARHALGGGAVSENDRFFANFQSFKNILKLVSLSLVMDVTTPVFRLYQRWHSMPELASLVHVLRLGCTIFEGATYGLMNRSLRNAYRDLLGLRRRQVAPRRRVVATVDHA